MDIHYSTLSILLSLTDGRLQVPLALGCSLVGMSSKTWRNRASEGRPPFPATMPPRWVDLRDLAAYIDARRPIQIQSVLPIEKVVCASVEDGARKRGRGRPSNASRLAVTPSGGKSEL